MTSIYIDIHNDLWLSYEYLRDKNIPEDSYMNWSKRDICRRMYLNGRAYIKYDTIPEPTRVKLPTPAEINEEIRRKKNRYTESLYTKELQAAYKCARLPHWVREIMADTQYSSLKREQITEFARKACVIEHALYIQKEYGHRNKLEGLFYAYCSIYPNEYSTKNRLSMLLKQAREKGILDAVIDKRMFREFKPTFGAVYFQMAEAILRDKRAFSMPACYEKFSQACEDLKIESPSFWWLRDYYRKNKKSIDIERFGKEVNEKVNQIYAKITPAKNRNSQWQIDGWEIPIYCKRPNGKGGFELWFKYVLVAVMDAHSRKMIGYCVAESENTTSILKAIEIAVKNTGVLPFEIVADNHSFNKTNEAKNLKAAMDKIGTTWTVDSNPRRKALLERAFRTLGEMHFKNHYGYIGQGVKSKMKGGRMPQELIDEYTKNQSRFLNYEQVVTIAMDCILEYNDKIKPTTKQSPNQRYELSKEKENCTFPIDDLARMSLFYKRTEAKVQHGQITIVRGMHTYEYQLPSQYTTAYNGQQVGVRYSDFDNIYLFDLESDDGICVVSQKNDIHGAMADQNKQDITNLYKNAGRMKGINSKESKRKQAIDNEANTINPNAVDAINKLKAPKELIKNLEQAKELQRLVIEQDVNIAKVSDLPIVKAIEYKEVDTNVNAKKSPFKTSNKVEISKISI